MSERRRVSAVDAQEREERRGEERRGGATHWQTCTWLRAAAHQLPTQRRSNDLHNSGNMHAGCPHHDEATRLRGTWTTGRQHAHYGAVERDLHNVRQHAPRRGDAVEETCTTDGSCRRLPTRRAAGSLPALIGLRGQRSCREVRARGLPRPGAAALLGEHAPVRRRCPPVASPRSAEIVVGRSAEIDVGAAAELAASPLAKPRPRRAAAARSSRSPQLRRRGNTDGAPSRAPSMTGLPITVAPSHRNNSQPLTPPPERASARSGRRRSSCATAARLAAAALQCLWPQARAAPR